MLYFATDTHNPPTKRILTPLAALTRLRPVTLDTLIQRTARLYYRIKAMALLKRFFPQEVSKIKPKHNWLEIFGHFLNLLEKKGWFEVDWQTINDIECSWNQTGEAFYEHYLAEFLDAIPVRVYGLTESDQDEYSALWILKTLLDVHTNIDPDFLIRYELYDALDDVFSKVEILDRVREADYSHLPEPLCRLAEVCEIVAGQTGNELLDTTLDITDWDMSRYLWERDLDRVKELYKDAKIRIEHHLEAFKEWLSAQYKADGYDTEETDQQIIELVSGAALL